MWPPVSLYTPLPASQRPLTCSPRVKATGVEATATQYPFGAGHYLETGRILEQDDLDALAKHDAILLGAIGGNPTDARLAGGIIERGLLLKLRFAFDHYVNLRPTTIFPGVESPLANPGDVDFLVVREGTEGPYVGNGGGIRVGTPHEIATEVSINTASGGERVVKFADMAPARLSVASRAVIVTDGERGAFGILDGQAIRSPAIPTVVGEMMPLRFGYAETSPCASWNDLVSSSSP